MYYHVGSNVPGYLPESDTYCTSDPTSAEDSLSFDLEQQRDYYLDQCEEPYGEECECPWCDIAGTISGELHEIGGGSVARSVELAGRYDVLLRPESGPDLVFWITAVGESCDCEEG